VDQGPRFRTDHVIVAVGAMTGKTAFVYGTLMAPEVCLALIKRVPMMKPAKLQGYKRHSVKGVVFPAIIPDDSDQVQGMVSLAFWQPAIQNAYTDIPA